MFLFNKFFKNIGIDLGTANTIIYEARRGFVLNQPTTIAYGKGTGIIAAGTEAMKMYGKTSSDVKVVRPMADGVISDFKAAEDLLHTFITMAGIHKFLINQIVIAVPTGITQVERNAILDSASAAGGRRSSLIHEPMAAAIGVGLDVFANEASMIIDIGGGTTDIAVINYGGIVLDNTLRMAGDEMNETVLQYFKNVHRLRIGYQTAEKIKMEHAVVYPGWKNEKFTVNGLDIVSRMPRKIELDSEIFIEALDPIIKIISNAALKTLDQLPPELAEDIIDRGVILTGGGSLLDGLDQYLRDQLNVPVSRADNALICVAAGTQKILESFEYYRPLLFP